MSLSTLRGVQPLDQALRAASDDASSRAPRLDDESRAWLRALRADGTAKDEALEVSG